MPRITAAFIRARGSLWRSCKHELFPARRGYKAPQGAFDVILISCTWGRKRKTISDHKFSVKSLRIWGKNCDLAPKRLADFESAVEDTDDGHGNGFLRSSTLPLRRRLFGAIFLQGRLRIDPQARRWLSRNSAKMNNFILDRDFAGYSPSCHFPFTQSVYAGLAKKLVPKAVRWQPKLPKCKRFTRTCLQTT